MNARFTRLAVALYCIACSKDDPAPDTDAPSFEGLRVIEGCVTVPDGVTVGSVFNAVEEVGVDGSGCFRIHGHDERSQLTFALGPDGDPLRMGWLTPERPTLDARITAESLLYFGIGGPLAGLDATEDLFELLEDAEPVDRLATALDDALADDPRAFADEHPATIAVMVSVAAELLASDAEPDDTDAPDTDSADTDGSDTDGSDTDIPVANAVLFNPSDEQSGIRLNTTAGVNSITFANALRRTAYAFVERVSTFNAEGVETASPKDIKELEVASVQGLQSWTDGFSQIVQASYSPGGIEGSQDVAYVPRSSGPVQLENVEGAKKTRYRVTLVGPGLRAGVAGQLTSKQAQQQLLTSAKFLVMDAFIPVFTQFIAPNLGWETVSDSPFIEGLATDIAKLLLAQTPKAVDLAAKGDPVGAIAQLWDAMAGSNTLRDEIMAQLLDEFSDFRTAGSELGNTRAAKLAMAFGKATGVVDSLLTGGDAAFLATSVAQSAQADAWIVDVADSTIRFDPEEAKVVPEGATRLTVNVIDAGDDVAFEYRFSVPGTFGSLEGEVSSGNAVTTSKNWIDYVAGTEEGTEKVRVDVYEIRLSERIEVGSAEATVEVKDECDETVSQQARFSFEEVLDYTCFTDEVCSRGWVVWSWRPVPGVWSFDLHITTPNDEYIGSTFVTGVRTVTLFANTGQPYRYYYNTQRAENYLSQLSEIRPVAANEFIYVPDDVSQFFTDNPDNLAIYRSAADRLAADHGASQIKVFPSCP